MSTKGAKENKQLNLKIKESPFNNLVKYKERFELFRAKWDIRKYTKSTWVWFTIVLSLSLVLTQIFTIQEKLGFLPKKIPLLQIYVDADKTLTSTTFIYFAPIISVIMLVLGIALSNKFYNKERDLSNTLLWSMFLANLIITVALIRLVNLY